jgi:quinohemoprotein ethanol dehydrogenase
MIKNILTMKTRNQTCSKNYPLLFISFLMIVASCADDPGTLPVSESVVNTERIMDAADEPGNWLTHGGTYNELRFSELDQINRENVDRLGLAWSYDFTMRGGVQATPLVVDGIMYLTGPWSTVYSMDARTGELLWQYDPDVPRLQGLKLCCGMINRGVALYEGKVYVGTLDARLIALDKETGEQIWETVTADADIGYSITGAPRVFNGKVVIGNGGAEFGGVRGFVTAYDAETGDQLWRTYTVPGNPADGFESPAMEYAAETWTGEWWKFGGGGTAWDSIVYDPELNFLYVGVGNGTPWNRMIRSPDGGDNLFLTSIMALDPDTGELEWYYQTTPGETWDFTATQPMILTSLEIDGKERQVIMQAPKNGFFYVLDREAGELLSAEPFVPVNWASHVDIETGRPVELPEARYEDAPFIMTPSHLGGHNWHPMSFNPITGLVYIPAQVTWRRYAHDTEFVFEEGEVTLGVASSREPIPPSRGYLLAWDPVEQEERWRVPREDLLNGGVLSTAGDLVFQGRGNGMFTAFDAHKGTRLWEYSSGLGIVAPPVTFDVDGTQYVTVAAGWGGMGPMGRSVAPPGEASNYQQHGRLMTFALGHDEPRLPLIDGNAGFWRSPDRRRGNTYTRLDRLGD